MIPKTIHYCWFGGAPKPDSVLFCIRSWEKYCPDYEIKEWNEGNFDILKCPKYVIDAYHSRKWAFVTDYARLKIIYENGGVYFDTDVELIQKIDNLLANDAFFGFEDGKHIATGLGFGAIQGLQLLWEMMEEYNSLPFVFPDGSYNLQPCPIINTKIFLNHGLIENDKKQILDDHVLILPSVYMCPVDFETGRIKKTHKTISIHWFDATWMPEEDRQYHEKHRERLQEEKRERWRNLPKRLLRQLIGEKRYDQLKQRTKQ